MGHPQPFAAAKSPRVVEDADPLHRRDKSSIRPDQSLYFSVPSRICW